MVVEASNVERDDAALREKRGAVRVLIIDDHRDAAEMAGLLLSMRGFGVSLAFSGEDALKQARETPFDVAFIDLQMPHMDGYATAAAFRSDPTLGGVALIALTGCGSTADFARTSAAGFALHLVKPATLHALEDAIFDVVALAAKPAD